MTQTKPSGLFAKMALGTILVLLMGSTLVPLAGANAPAPASGQVPSWAYGGSKVVNANGSFTTGTGLQVAFVLHAYYGWAVIYNQTNTSSSTYEIQGQRTVGIDSFLQFCTPTCTSPSKSVNITSTAWERDNAFANFTTTGTVYVNGSLNTLGTPTPALALENANMNTRANVTMVRTSSASSYEGYASAAVQSSGLISFQPALGLYPLSPVVQGEHWNATSNFTANMAWTGSYHLHNPMMGTVSGSLNNHLNSTGTVMVFGGDDQDFNLGGQYVHAIGMHVMGPIRFVDGWFPLPVDADLLSDTTHPWEEMGPMGAAMGMGDVDVGPHVGHLGMIAASANYQTSADDPMEGTGMGPGGPGPMTASATPATTGPAPASVQAQPMSVTQAEALSAALLQVGNSANHSPTHSGLFLVLIGAVVVTTVVLAAAYVGTQRLKPRRPTSTNYTPYQQAGAPTSAHPQSKDPAPGEPKDPLDHLM